MKALVRDKYGSPDLLEISEVAQPVPRDDEVLVRVHAASVNDWDLGMLGGGFNRVFAGLFRPTTILGCDIAGRVAAVGRNVQGFKPGDEVFGDLSRFGGFGGFAQYACARTSSLALKSPRMSFEQAAAIPQAGVLALECIRARGQLQPGQKILINGAGGGVGTFAIQLAKLHDVEVTGVDSALKLDLMRSLGFDHVIDYRKQDFTATGERYDLIVDAKTNRAPRDYARALNRNGVYATSGGERLLELAIMGRWAGRAENQTLSLVMLRPGRDLQHFNELFDAGKLQPVIDGPYPWTQAREAFHRFAASEHKGKIVLTLD